MTGPKFDEGQSHSGVQRGLTENSDSSKNRNPLSPEPASDSSHQCAEQLLGPPPWFSDLLGVRLAPELLFSEEVLLEEELRRDIDRLKARLLRLKNQCAESTAEQTPAESVEVSTSAESDKSTSQVTLRVDSSHGDLLPHWKPVHRGAAGESKVRNIGVHRSNLLAMAFLGLGLFAASLAGTILLLPGQQILPRSVLGVLLLCGLLLAIVGSFLTRQQSVDENSPVRNSTDPSKADLVRGGTDDGSREVTIGAAGSYRL